LIIRLVLVGGMISSALKLRLGGSMATNGKAGDNRRHGMVRERSQIQTSSGHWVKRDANTGRFMDVKSDGTPFKGVRKEK